MNGFKTFVTAGLEAPERVKFGLAAEEFALKVIQQMLGDVHLSSGREDTGRAKVDAHITSRINGQTVQAQVKCREGGQDIIVEWYKYYEKKIEGRDKISQAQLYITMDPGRTKLYLVSAAAIKQDCEKMFQTWETTKQTKFPNGELKFQPSKDIMTHDAHKVMIFLHPEAYRMKGLPGWPSVVMIPKAMNQPTTVSQDPRV